MDHCLVTIFLSEDIVSSSGAVNVQNVHNLATVPLYGYHKKGECSRGGKTIPQHILVITSTRPAGAGTNTPPCTCPSRYLQLGELTTPSTKSSTRRRSRRARLPTPQPKSSEHTVWIHVNITVAGLLSIVVIEQATVDLENVSLIFYSPCDICQSDLLSLKYPYHSKADVFDAQPVSFCIAKVQKQFQSQVQTRQTSKYILYKFLRSAAFLYEKVLSLPNLCIGLQSPLDRLFGYKSATLQQVSLRIDQLKEIQQLLHVFLEGYSRTVDTLNQPDTSLQGSSWRCTKGAHRRSMTNLTAAGEALASENKSQSPSTGSFSTESTETNSPHVCYSCSTSSGITLKTRAKTNRSSSACLVLGRLVFLVVADLALGAVLLHLLLSVVSVDGLFDTFRETTQGVSDGVLRLLSWLRGAPAGLKLNQPLARALATFFSYHVGLWMLYLEVASGVVYGLCWGLVWSGVLGASVQVALLADMLHLATLHLHCIYVYAARLHMVQVSLFGSQWRAFRGHKWNPLKQRVDSLHPPLPVVVSSPNSEHAETNPLATSHTYDTRQIPRGSEETSGNIGDTRQGGARSGRGETAPTWRRGSAAASGSASVPSSPTVLPEVARVTSKPLSRVLSAVIFTLVVFLFPTTTVFYLVFVSLRLVLFLASNVLSALAWLLHHNPLYLVLLTLCRSSKLKGDLYFETLPHEDSERPCGPLLLSLTVRPSGLLTSLRQYATSDVLPSLAAPDMGQFLQTVLYARQLL